MHFRSLVVLAVAACSSPPDRRPSQEAARDDRRWLPVSYDTVWQVGGNETDTLLGYPSRLATVGSQVVFSDPGFHRVVALHSKDGTVAWTSGGRIAGEYVHAKPLMLGDAGGDTVVVFDDRLGRFSLIRRDGRLIKQIELPVARRVNALCPLGRDQLVIASTDPAGPFYMMDMLGNVVRRVPLAATDLAGRHGLQLQAELSMRTDRTACAVALNFGNWLALTDGGRILHTARYREEVPLPRIDSVTTRRGNGDEIEEATQYKMAGDVRMAALGLSATPGRIHVLFGGRSPDAGRIIDDYDDQTLEYLGSRRLPFRATNLATPASGLIVLLTEERGYPIIRALRQHQRAR